MPTATFHRDVVLRDAVMKDLPPLSPMAMKLVGKLARTEVDFAEVEHIIEKDTMLCAELLRTVNSARFSRGRRVNRIHEAVMLLGTNRLRRIALGMTVSHMFGRAKTGAKWSQLRFNLHSAAVGVLAEILTSQLPVNHPEAAFVAGLLHDVGKFAMAVNLHAESEKILGMWQSGGVSMAACEREVLGFDHAEISGLMMERWQMPDYIQWAVSCHHNPAADVTAESNASRKEAAPSGPAVNLSRVLQVADRFTHSLGMMAEPAPSDLGEPMLLELPGFALKHEELASQFALEYAEFSEFLR